MFLPNLRSPLYFLSRKELYQHRKKAHPIYLKSCTFFGATLIDRTQTLVSGFDFTIIDPLPCEPTTLTLEEVCALRAKGILEQTTGKLHVLWSGGIDSTLALISLLKTARLIGQEQRIEIILSKESIAEYPSFFRDVIDGKIPFKQIEGTIYEYINSEDIIITGEHGDQLFGSDKLKLTVLSGDAFSPYSEILDFIISRKLGTDEYTNDIIDYLDPLIQKAPFKIVTLYDYMWWLNFSLKWQNVSMRLVHGLERKVTDLEQNVFHFFKDKAFQGWSIANHDLKIKREWNTYKFASKEIIYQFHPDENYLVNKEKEPSLKEVIVSPKEKWGFLKRFLPNMSNQKLSHY